jgi:enoyl-[acyl-carrier protein] reductase I
MLPIDLRGKRALVAGVADDGGFGFAIAKALAEAGATVCVGSWPPAMGIFEKLLARGKMDDSLTLSDGSKMAFEGIFPLDAAFDTLEDVPEEIRENKRYADRGDFTIAGLAASLEAAFGSPSWTSSSTPWRTAPRCRTTCWTPAGRGISRPWARRPTPS